MNYRATKTECLFSLTNTAFLLIYGHYRAAATHSYVIDSDYTKSSPWNHVLH